LKQKLPKF